MSNIRYKLIKTHQCIDTDNHYIKPGHMVSSHDNLNALYKWNSDLLARTCGCKYDIVEAE